MKVRSVTDVITNSSTEVFAMTSGKTVDDLKEMINLLLLAAESKYSCDDLFEVRLVVPEDARYFYDPDENDGREWTDMSEEEKLRYCIEFSGWDRPHLYPVVKVVPRSKYIQPKLLDLLEKSSTLGLSKVDVCYN